MLYTTKIHFSGLMLFYLPYQSPVNVIIPRVDATKIGDYEIGKHIAYIAFRRGKATVTNWTTAEFPPYKDEFDWVMLTGETIKFSMGGSPLQFSDFLPHLKDKYCTQLDKLKDVYVNDTESAGRVILKGGDDVGWHVTPPPRYRIETVVLMHSSDAPLTLTATKGATTRTLKFSGEANVIVGNSDEDAIYGRQVSNEYDFRFYYQMFDTNTGCNAVPVAADAAGNPNVKDPVVELPPLGQGAIDIACSNSQYP